MKNELLKIVKKINGNIIVIGNYNDKILDEIEKNNNILSCDILTNKVTSNDEGKSGHKRKFYISNLRKKYKKKKIDYVIVDAKEVEKYLKTFIKDTIFINKKEVIFISDKDYDLDIIKNRYYRYKTSIEIQEYKSGKILKINTNKAKTNKIKDIFYYIIDSIINLIDLISEFLVS